MKVLRIFYLLLVFVLIITGCKGKKNASGNDPVELSDFIGYFPDQKLPYQFNDSTLAKLRDTQSISSNVFAQFVPDSFTSKSFGKGAKAKFYPLGKINVSGAERYLFARAVAGDKKAAYVFAFNKNDELVDGIQLFKVGEFPGAQQTVSVDKNYSITRTITRKNNDGTTSDGKDVYGLSGESGKFMLIMTDALDDKNTELVNPIDTFSKKHKYAGDYGVAKMSIVSFRDGRKSDRLSFYIHFEKNNGGCTGDLKGEAFFRSANIAEYREGGDPCVLRFTFTASSVIVKEMEGCGAHRGLRCSFDGTFAKKKDAKPAVKKKAVKSK